MKKEKGCMGEDVMMENCDETRDPKLDAAMEVAHMMSRALEHFTWLGIADMDSDQAESRQDLIKLKIAFLREIGSLLEPALQYVEQYVEALIQADGAEDALEGEND